MKRFFPVLGLAMMVAVLLGACTAEVGDGRTAPAEEVGTSEQALSPCSISSIASGTWYLQSDTRWASVLLGNSSTDTIGASGCVISCLAMAYNDVWSKPTSPSDLNTSAISAGCFAPGSSAVTVSCAINSRGGPHSVTSISMSAVATAICAGYPVMVDTTWGTGHKLLVYSYNGGSTTAMSSYTAVDPFDGTSKALTAFTATQWRELQ